MTIMQPKGRLHQNDDEAAQVSARLSREIRSKWASCRRRLSIASRIQLQIFVRTKGPKRFDNGVIVVLTFDK